jgi:hypothetical protein
MHLVDGFCLKTSSVHHNEGHLSGSFGGSSLQFTPSLPGKKAF